ERAMLALLLIGLAESFAFPLSYNEYTTLAAPEACGASPQMEPALVAAGHLYSPGFTGLQAAIFDGTPVWLCPVYRLGLAPHLAAPLPFPHVPVDAQSVPAGAALAVAAGLAALAIANRWRAWEARVPVLEWERYPARVAAWWHAR